MVMRISNLFMLDASESLAIGNDLLLVDFRSVHSSGSGLGL